MEPIIAAIALLFAANEPNSAKTGVGLESSQWRVVLDGVMGGLSSGKLTETPSGLRFTGDLSLKNNGGFAWARTRRLDLDANFEGFEIEFDACVFRQGLKIGMIGENDRDVAMKLAVFAIVQ